MKHTIFLFALLLSASTTINAKTNVEKLAQKAWSKTYKQILSQIQEVSFKDASFNIVDYGASIDNDAKTNQIAINKAIMACYNGGGGHVVVPSGTFITGAITLQSDVDLHLEEGATLLFSTDTKLYPLAKTRWEGVDCWNYQPMIYAYGCKNVGLSGKGIVDGGASNDDWWQMCGAVKFGWSENSHESQRPNRPILLQMNEDGVDVDQRIFGLDKGMRPQLINFYECENVLIEGVTILRSPFWTVHPLLCKNVIVRGIRIDNAGPNGDGCDPESCENVLIEDCYFNTGDDCIAIKSGRNRDGRQCGLPSKNLVVRNCRMANGHGGVVVGSEISGGCENVFVENCDMDSPSLERVIRIKTNPCRGGTTDGVWVRNVVVGECDEAVLKINLDYDAKEQADRTHYPVVQNVYLENVTSKKSKYGTLIIGLQDRSNVHNIAVKNCRFEGIEKQDVEIRGMADNVQINGKQICE